MKKRGKTEKKGKKKTNFGAASWELTKLFDNLLRFSTLFLSTILIKKMLYGLKK